MTDEEKETLNKLVAKPTTPQAKALRARMILQFYEDNTLSSIARVLGVEYKTVLKWIKRWKSHPEIEVEERLEDLPRSGCPDKFSPEQVCKIIATCCEKPEEYGRPITHWTQRELADEVIKQKIVSLFLLAKSGVY